MTKTNKLIATAGAVATVLAFSPMSVLATTVTNIDLGLNGGSFVNIVNYTPTRVVQAVINILLVVVGLVAFFWLLLGGVQWIMAGGDKEGTEKARKRITAALIGLAIVFSVFAFVQILSAFFGVNLLNFSINAI